VLVGGELKHEIRRKSAAVSPDRLVQDLRRDTVKRGEIRVDHHAFAFPSRRSVRVSCCADRWGYPRNVIREALQKQLELAQQITHIGSWQWDVATNRVMWSDELYRIYGLEPQSVEISFESFIARVHPDDRARTTSAVTKALATGGKFSYPERIVRPDGSIRELETVGEAVLDGAKVTGLVGTCRDVTDARMLDQLVQQMQIALVVFKVGTVGDPKTYKLLAFNPAAERIAKMDLSSRIGDALPDILPFARGGQLERLLESVAHDGGVHETAVYRSADPNAPTRAVALKCFPLPGGHVGLAAEDITEGTRARLLREGEQRVLERIAGGSALPEILDAICRLVEEHAPPALASILLVDADGEHLRHGAAPHLPRAYIHAIDGSRIGERAGSCGTAVWRKAPVHVLDIATDPLWADYKQLALPHHLRACWSTPIFSRDGRVLGTFALYYTEPRASRPEDEALVARATEIAGIAIQRHQLEQQLRDLTAHAESAREEERIGIARELHDSLGQALTALKMDVAWIARHVESGDLPREALLEKAKTISTTSDELIAATRRISADLRPGVLDTFGLVAAFEWQVQDFSDRTGIPCELITNLGLAKIERDTSTVLFRVLQEGLTNVARHANATHVEVKLEVDGDELRLEVRDDGRGVTPEHAHGVHSLGLLGVRERARRLGGFAVITGEPGKGTVLRVSIPFRGQRTVETGEHAP
jgi:PAS domain S-box-containing protein